MGELEIAEELVIAPEVSVRHDDADHDIIRLARARNLDVALTRLMQRHGAAVYRYCREALRDAALAEDVHQQVFVQAYRDLRRFMGRSTLRTWLFAIARNRVLDAIKARRRALSHLDDDDTADAVDLAPAAGDQLDDARLRHALVHCLGMLGEHMQTALLLRFQLGFTFEEMAEICGERAGTLQARVARALPVLQACIEARLAGGPEGDGRRRDE
jgi:RNA polymerase sigma-70 factor (ECF subfamily)